MNAASKAAVVAPRRASALQKTAVLSLLVAAACSSAPVYEIVAGGPDGGADAGPDSTTPRDTGVDALVDTGHDTAVDAGPTDSGVSTTPELDLLTSDPACLIAYQAPVGVVGQTVTEIATDRRCGAGVRFSRPSPVTWGGTTLKFVKFDDSDAGTPRLAVESALPDGTSSASKNLSLAASGPVSTAAHEEWTLIVVSRAKPFGAPNDLAQPFFQTNGPVDGGIGIFTGQYIFRAAPPAAPSTIVAASGVNPQGAWIGMPLTPNADASFPIDPTILAFRYSKVAGLRIRETRKHAGATTTYTYVGGGTNGAASPSFLLPPMPAGTTRLLGGVDGTQFLNGAVGSFYLVGKELSDAQQLAVVGELQALYDIR